MFYTENKIIPYPAKQIKEDCLTRVGPAEMESFTPYSGMNEIIKEQLQDKAVSVYDLISWIEEFDPHKYKASDDRESYKANEIDRYYTRLEDIDEQHIRKFLTDQIIGFKLNNKGLKTLEYNMQDVYTAVDDETGSVVTGSDLIQTERGFAPSVMLEAKEKLPYCLKMLHQGSIEYQGSLLSFIIAKAKVMRYAKNEEVVPKPKDYIASKVYRVDKQGNCCEEFKPSDNTAAILRTLIEWANGADEGDRYMNAGIELMSVCTILGLDITKEDARLYTSDVIERAVCTYLASNEEYIESHGLVDKKLIEALNPENLFSTSYIQPNMQSKPAQEDTWLLSERIAINFPFMRLRNTVELIVNPRHNLREAQQFFDLHARQMRRPEAPQVSNYNEKNGFFVKSDGSYVTLFTPYLFSVGVETSQRQIMVTTTGVLVWQREFKSLFYYMTIDNAIKVLKGLPDGSQDWAAIQI